MSICPKKLEILNFEQLLKHIFKSISKFGEEGEGGGGEFNSVGLDHSGSQPFNYYTSLLCNTKV